jgi:hypothetical protein
MFALGTSLAMLICLSASASSLATTTVDGQLRGQRDATNNGAPTPALQENQSPQQSSRRNGYRSAAASTLGNSNSRGSGDIVSIADGCPGNGSLDATYNGSTIHMTATGLPSQVFSVFVYGPPLGAPIPFYDGTICTHWGLYQRSIVSLTSVSGITAFDGVIQPNAGDGQVLSVQCMYRSPTETYGGNLTDGILVTFEP